jgi:hypothetical protein
MMLPLALAHLLACSGETASDDPSPKPEPAPAAQPASTFVPLAERDGMHVQPLSIGWDDESSTLSVEASLVGIGVSERKEPVHVGVTAVTEAGDEVDLLVHTLFPAAMGESVLFTTSLDSPPKHVLVGAWNERVEPCDSERPGCKEFGFVLDGSIASFPAKLYTEGMRQRMIPDGLAIHVKGADPSAIETLANRYAKPFGATVTTEAYTGDEKPGVWTQRSDDLGLAHHLADAYGLEYGMVKGLDVPVAVVLP